MNVVECYFLSIFAFSMGTPREATGFTRWIEARSTAAAAAG